MNSHVINGRYTAGKNYVRNHTITEETSYCFCTLFKPGLDKILATSEVFDNVL
jgi:hypothetical protein